MQQTCNKCSASFEITDDDLAFLKRVSPVINEKTYEFAPPTLCPDCRMQRRLAFGNRYNLYKRKCAISGKEIVSTYSPDKDLPVIKETLWWEGKWDPFEHGKDISFSDPIFEQTGDLFPKVPQMGLFNADNINSPYVNWTGWAKNCHLCYGADHSEDCMYTEAVYHSKNTLECTYCHGMERSYECLDCKDCYELFFSQNCVSCSDSYFLYGCIGCRDCFGCVNQHQKQYMYFNEQLSKEDYENRIKKHFPLNHSLISKLKNQLEELRIKIPHRFMTGTHNQGSTGDYLHECKNAQDCFDCLEIEDCRYSSNIRRAKDCRDINFWGHPGELLYEDMAAGEGASKVCFTICAWGGTHDVYYCLSCIACKNCIACSGLHRKEYCILNKQYSKEEYEQLAPKVIEHMCKTKEWGEFFPVENSLYAYNETLANDFFPLSKEEVKANGWKWHELSDDIPQVEKTIPADRLPDSITDIPDDILNWAVKCKETQRPYVITKQELAYYREMKLPVPNLHPDVRRSRRHLYHNPRILWSRKCDKCEKDIKTSYDPQRPEKVYCEDCYLKEVY
ncbi:hypothetical protein KJ652_07200 [Patescibacteria group bacterium]|nr:hypothetical protein [Patescibacteria group bacterium]MBU1124336.1 hypothetical protein [Patescibacteria group bacterium]